jgi:hypothetical protein
VLDLLCCCWGWGASDSYAVLFKFPRVTILLDEMRVRNKGLQQLQSITLGGEKGEKRELDGVVKYVSRNSKVSVLLSGRTV